MHTVNNHVVWYKSIIFVSIYLHLLEDDTCFSQFERFPEIHFNPSLEYYFKSKRINKTMGGKKEKAKVGGKETSGLEVPADSEIDVMERDPNDVNSHLLVAFAEVFAEPDPTIFSFDKVWILSFKVFTAVKLWTYRIITLICAIPCACLWGCHFAFLSFCYIWVCIPSLKTWFIQLVCTKQMFNAIMQAFVAPVWRAVGAVFSYIRVAKVGGADMDLNEFEKLSYAHKDHKQLVH
ncbi:unnamed protein product [Owenia fusiformis]|uniref:Caveolin n=1 Tax=Owenia fusiformis TaxID=6347 RepID=A0A8J1U141_OWEFU|nr:unnamed protein product [Owenia fusiformis]